MYCSRALAQAIAKYARMNYVFVMRVVINQSVKFLFLAFNCHLSVIEHIH